MNRFKNIVAPKNQHQHRDYSLNSIMQHYITDPEYILSHFMYLFGITSVIVLVLLIPYSGHSFSDSSHSFRILYSSSFELPIAVWLQPYILMYSDNSKYVMQIVHFLFLIVNQEAYHAFMNIASSLY